ncbi:hypothetical protein EPN87_04320 [archaeon]|nr:MAG: hypothetical protein EPN87_04320 [archaeon]
MGDGHVQGWPKWRIDFTSKDLSELSRFNKEVQDMFGVSGKVRPCTTNRFGKTFNLGINCKLLARVLNIAGAPTGAKVLKEFSIPEWVVADKENFRSFMRSLFTCEGCVSLDGRNSFVEISMWKSVQLLPSEIEFFKQIKNNLKEHFSIETTNPFLSTNTNVRKDGIVTRGVRLRIKKLDSLIRFSNDIGFHTIEKQKKLNSSIELKSTGLRTGQ